MRLSADVHRHCAESRPEERRGSRRRSAEALQRGACTLWLATHMCQCAAAKRWVMWAGVQPIVLWTSFFFSNSCFCSSEAQRFETFLSTQLRTLCFSSKYISTEFALDRWWCQRGCDSWREQMICLWCVSVFTCWYKSASYMSVHACAGATVLRHWPGDHCWVFPCSFSALSLQPYRNES